MLGIERLEARWVPATITPLLVENTLAFDRLAEPVTSGVPLPASLNLTSPDRLRILDGAGREIPSQFRVLGRWGGGATDTSRPIRWLEVHFAADVPSRATATYTLDDAGTGSAAAGLATTRTADRITVSTGPARFEIDRGRFDLFRTVWLDTDADGRFTDDERIVTPTPTAGPFVSHQGTEYRGNAQAPRAVVLEESGPLRAVVRAEGFHAAGGRPLLRFVTRLTFHAGLSHVEINHTIIEGRQSGSGNESIEGQVATSIERAGLRLALRLAGPVTARLRGNEDTVHTAPLSTGQTAAIAQDRLTDWTRPMAYRGTIGGVTVETGQRAARAWAAIGDGRWGVAVGTRDFYRKNPQRVAVGADGTVLVEFPSEPYLIRQAMGLGESAVIWFHAGEATAAGTERIMEGFGKDRLLATTPGDWARATGALGEVPGPLPSRWARVDDYLRDSAAASLEHASSGAAFGLMNYLDMPIDRYGRAANPDDTAWGNSYWDPAASLAAQFARTGDTRLLGQLLFPMARHFYTTDMYDPDDAGSYTSGIGGARGVAHRGAWTGEYHYLESLWDHYSLTGDPRALERGLAAARTYAFHPQWAVTADQGGFETTTRSLSQKFNTMMEAWLATGDAALKTALDAQVREYLTRRFTPEGFATAGPATGSSYRAEQAFMILLGMHDTMYRYFQLTGDPAARSFVVTIPERISQHYRVGQEPGSADFMRFHTNVVVNRVAGGGFTVTRIAPHGTSDDFFYTDAHVGLATALARAWQVGGDPAHRARAEELFDFVIPQLQATIWDKPNAMTSRRLLPGLGLLTKDAPPVVPAPIVPAPVVPAPVVPAPVLPPPDRPAGLTLAPVADGFIDGRFGTDPAANFGTTTPLGVYREGWSGGRIRPLLRFDLGVVPAGRRPVRAVLRMTQVGGEGAAVPLPVTIRAIGREWVEGQAGWRFARDGEPWHTAGGDTVAEGVPATLPAVTGARRVVELDITPLVRHWVDNAVPNHGLLIDVGASDVAQYYASREAADAADRPALLLDFEPPTANLAPTLAGPGGTRTFRPGRGPVMLAPAATVVDPDTVRFGGAVLTVQQAGGGTPRDRLHLVGGVAGRITVRGSAVRVDGIQIGTFVGGNANRPLVITFNRLADRDGVQAVLRSVAFQTAERPAWGPRRSIRITLREAAGGISRPLVVSLEGRA